LRGGLIQPAQVAVKCKNTIWLAVYHRLVVHRGKQKAIVPVAHRILTIAYHILLKQQPDQDLGARYLSERRQDKLLNRLRCRIEQLGYRVTLS